MTNLSIHFSSKVKASSIFNTLFLYLHIILYVRRPPPSLLHNILFDLSGCEVYLSVIHLDLHFLLFSFLYTPHQSSLF